MIGAIIGDIVGSRFEWHNIKTKYFDLFARQSHPTDDSIMTLAIAKAVLEYKEGKGELDYLAIKNMQELGNRYPHVGYGGRFSSWLTVGTPKPYNSFGNGSAMRVSPCGFAAETIDEAVYMAREVTKVTHNHPEGIKGAEATAVAVFLANNNCIMPEIKEVLDTYYLVDFTLDDIREDYKFDVSCQGTMPVALAAFYESTSFEDAIRNAISIGGDSDTIAAITGAIAEAYYGVPKEFYDEAIKRLYDDQLEIFRAFDAKYPWKREVKSNNQVDYTRNQEDQEIRHHLLAVKKIIDAKCVRCKAVLGCLGCEYSKGELAGAIDRWLKRHSNIK